MGTVFEVLLAILVMPSLGWRWLLGFSTVPFLIFVLFCYVSMATLGHSPPCPSALHPGGCAAGVAEAAAYSALTQKCEPVSAWLPESARYDVLSGHPERALATFSRIATDNNVAMPAGTITAARQEHRGRFRDLFSPEYWRTTVMLWFIWQLYALRNAPPVRVLHSVFPFCLFDSTTSDSTVKSHRFLYLALFSTAFSYFGLVLLTSELLRSADLCGVSSGGMTESSCSLQCKRLTSEDYKDMLWTTLAEFPGSAPLVTHTLIPVGPANVPLLMAGLVVTVLAIDRIGRKKTMVICFLIFSTCILPLYTCINSIEQLCPLA
ncbi:hypothetical protein JZ751_005735 [Albula glossodonta]|uniref:Uncharacterized protein n=1 Tax=Albula glossodonta TaxID=121402 RepID=A0A8T2N6P3_9TELE|nr:hypothetical protein JZ751_005735 [Albula glossodonta]